jgi:MFS family permease
VTPVRLTILLCAAQVLSMVGTFAFPALLPSFIAEWGLSNTEAGWIAGLFYAGYTVAVPLLVGLTDRIDARLIYVGGALLGAVGYGGFALFAEGFWSAVPWWTVAGMALAGTYMPGLRALVDRLGKEAESRAVAFYTSCFSLGTAGSFTLSGEIAAAAGWRWAFGLGAVTAFLAAGLSFFGLKPKIPPRGDDTARLFDFRAVFANRPAVGFMLGYGIHTLELFAFRSWIVALMAFSLMQTGGEGVVSPTVVGTLTALTAMASSIIGQEFSMRIGRSRFIMGVMVVAGIGAIGFGSAAALPYGLAIAIALVYAVAIQADSAALTAGLVDAAEPARRGLSMAAHSVIGFFGAFLGPLIVGVVLDLAGGAGRPQAWALAFACIGVTSVFGIAALSWSGRPKS